MPHAHATVLSPYAPRRPPSMEVMMNLRNPTLDKFLPPKV